MARSRSQRIFTGSGRLHNTAVLRNFFTKDKHLDELKNEYLMKDFKFKRDNKLYTGLFILGTCFFAII